MKIDEMKEKNLALLPCIHEGRNYRLHLQQESAYGGPVVIKSLRLSAGEQSAGRMANEFSQTADLDLPGVRRARGRLLIQGRPALVLDYVEGETLRESHVKKRQSLTKNLEVAIAIAKVLDNMHRRHLIHRNLASTHILVSSPIPKITLIGFGDSSTEEAAELQVPDLSASMLAYISPEQTGRTNQPVDHRADLYSFGAVLYEVFTGTPPFESEEASELVYAHMAKIPRPPRESNTRLPKVISDMIMRLLAKNPDERYQSAYGILKDLEGALKQLRKTEQIGDMTLAQTDYSGLFHLPERIYGRETELEIMRAALREIETGGVVMVSGPAGSGKSALVEALRPYAAERGVYFLTGSYESSQRHVPYAGLRQAFSEWIDLILTESPEHLDSWRSQLLEVGGDDVGMLLDMLPHLKLIIGQQSSSPELGPAQAQHRFRNLLRSFIHTCAQPERPLVLFLDNLQWADQASLQLLDSLLPSIDSQPMLFITAYREDEMGMDHPFSNQLDSPSAKGGKVRTLFLGELPADGVNRLIADTLKVDVSDTVQLTKLVLEKTGGNPLFVRQFLQSLYEKKILVFQEKNHRWDWDTDAIRIRTVIGSVAELMAEKIGDLPEATCSILAFAACIGIRFPIRLLAALVERPESEVNERLQPAVEAGHLLAASFPPAPGSGEGAEKETGFQFSHDRVRQAAYELLPQKQRRLNHLQAGRMLLAETPQNLLEEHVFDIADQLNEGFEYLQDEQERHRLIALNLMAGRKARRAAATLAAIRYLSMGIGLLPSDCWQSRAEPTLELYMEAVEAEYLSANFERAAVLSKEVLQHSSNLFTRLRVHELRVLFLTAQGQGQLAVEAGLAALEELGISLTEKPHAEDQQELVAIIHRVDSLKRLPVLSDPKHLASLRVLMHLVVPAQRTNPLLLENIIAKMVLLSVRHGNSPIAAIAYGWYGAVLCGSADSAEAGYRFGQLSHAVLLQFQASELESRASILFNAYVRHWKEPVREGIYHLQEVFQRGLETGDLEYTSLGAVHHCGYLLFSGWPLEVVRRKMQSYLGTIERWRLPFQGQLLRIWLQTATNLCCGNEDPTRLRGEIFDESKYVPGWVRDNDVLSMYCVLCGSSMLQYIFGDYRAAASSGKEAEKYERAALGLYYRINHSFYYALSLLALNERGSGSAKTEQWNAVNAHIKRLRQWTLLAPMNVAHKLALVEAEQARVRHEKGRAIERFNDAVRLARENDHLMDEALICEREAAFYSSLGRGDIAEVSLRKALDIYRSWGALRKVQALESRFESLLQPETALIDTAAVLQASQTLSQEVHLGKLLEKLMRIVIKNAGAERGILIQKSHQDELTIQASGVGDDVKTMQGIPLSGSDELAHSVVNYVARTNSEVVLGDARRDSTFGSDKYIVEHRVRSLFCLPLVYQGKLSGVLYLENNLASDVFTADRLELLKTLASQAAISIENATLYTALESNIAALRESEQKFRVIFDQTFQFIGMLDRNGTLMQANRSALQFAGIDAKAVIGKPFWDTPWWAHSAKLRKRLKRAVQEAKTGKMVRFEASHINPDGKKSYIDFSLKPVTDSKGHVVLLIPEGRDITERKQAEEVLLRYKEHLEETVQQRTEELRLARDAAETANKAKSAFLANMSHELRTPLNSILGFSRMMQQDSALSESQRENLSIISSSGEHLLKLINDVLEIAKIEAGKLQLQISSFDLHVLVSEVYDMMRLRAEEKGLQLVLDQSSTFPHYIEGDEARLRQILVNLVSNAVKFTDEGVVTIRLGIKDNKQHNLLIEIEDTGQGINEQDQQRLFKPFVQLPEGEMQMGTGLGLSIVQQFVELMNGTVSVESEPGKGSIFRVQFPVNEVAEDIIRPDNAGLGEVIGLEPGQPSYKILVADDQRDNQLLLARLMTDIGLEVKVADDGEQCVQLFKEWGADLIWMDRRMPVMDGVEATRQIRQLPDGDKVKIIAVTASAFREQEDELRATGMEDYVSKPYRFEEIYGTLEQHLGLRFTREEAVAEQAPPALDRERLATLPDAVCVELRQALESLESSAIEAAIQKVGEHDPELARNLSRISDGLDYQVILDVLQEA
jgi:PAS domain S-box-containing protein